MERTVNRVELDQQGKNRLHLSMDLLNGSAEEAFDKSLPTLKKRLDKVIDKGVLVVDDFWKKNGTEQFKALFLEKK
jgi:hypothetical protein